MDKLRIGLCGVVVVICASTGGGPAPPKQYESPRSAGVLPVVPPSSDSGRCLRGGDDGLLRRCDDEE